MSKPPKFARVLERLLCKPRGRRPYVLERLACGHYHVYNVAAQHVAAKTFPTKPTKSRLCRVCSGDLSEPEALYPSDDPAVLTEKLPSFLDDFTQQVWSD